MRIAILWKQMSGYASASVNALRDRGVDVLLVYPAAKPEAPFEDDELDLGVDSLRWTDRPDEADILRQVERFSPDALLVVSWDLLAYRRVSRRLRGRTLRVLCMDNQWLGTAKQWGGRAVSPVLIRPTYDVAFVPGERQAAFARRLGFAGDRILWGLYTCDHPTFASVRNGNGGECPPSFLFVGRLAPEKGVDVLAEAYRDYRRASRRPWPLVVCGTGPMERSLAGIPGVEMLGFVQPRQLPPVFARTGCLVQPSRFEPWGVTIHEAAAAGLAVVCTSCCGASTRLVLDGYNGAVVPPGDAAALAGAMARVAADGVDRAAMSRRSTELARQFTPDRWASYLVDRVGHLRLQLGLDSP